MPCNGRSQTATLSGPRQPPCSIHKQVAVGEAAHCAQIGRGQLIRRKRSETTPKAEFYAFGEGNRSNGRSLAQVLPQGLTRQSSNRFRPRHRLD